MVEFSAGVHVLSQLILNTILGSVHFAGRETEAQEEDSHRLKVAELGFKPGADGLTFDPVPHCL